MLSHLRQWSIVLVTMLIVLSCQSQIAVGNSLKILLPLYTYPNWYEPENYVWSEVVQAAAKIPIVAIINPNNGTNGQPPNRDYQRGLEDLRATNMTILGYVYTQYGDRPLDEVKQEIDLYARYYEVDGIFLDETASSFEKIDYYREIYRYTKANEHLQRVVINPGTDIDESYLAKPVADTAVIVENYPQVWEQYQPPLYLSKYSQNRFASLIHSVAQVDAMKQYIDLAIARNFGYIYITDDSPESTDGNPWNSLPTYWQEEVDYIYNLRQSAF